MSFHLYTYLEYRIFRVAISIIVFLFISFHFICFLFLKEYMHNMFLEHHENVIRKIYNTYLQQIMNVHSLLFSMILKRISK